MHDPPRILVVDDEPNMRELVQGRLEASGYEVQTAEDGYKALARVRSFHPDLLILDLMLPKMDGYTVCRMLRSSLGERLPIIMFTARSAPDDERRGREMGADGYVTKPFDGTVLLDTVHKLLHPEEEAAKEAEAAAAEGEEAASEETPVEAAADMPVESKTEPAEETGPSPTDEEAAAKVEGEAAVKLGPEDLKARVRPDVEEKPEVEEAPSEEKKPEKAEPERAEVEAAPVREAPEPKSKKKEKKRKKKEKPTEEEARPEEKKPEPEPEKPAQEPASKKPGFLARFFRRLFGRKSE